MTRVACVSVYLAGTAVAVLLVDVDAENGRLAVGIWAVASLLLGWGTGRPAFAPLALLAVPFAVPFGFADQYLGSDAPRVWWFALFYGVGSALLIALAAWARRRFESRKSGDGASRVGPWRRRSMS